MVTTMTYNYLFIFCTVSLTTANPSDLIQLFNLTSVQINDIVNSHNQIRRSVRATNMQEIIWNDYLASFATQLAQNCTGGHRSGSHQYDNTTIGENIYQSFNLHFLQNTNLSRPAHAWYEYEVGCFNMTSLECGRNCIAKRCGHFMQVIHHSVSAIGCSMALCKSGYDSNVPNAGGYLVVCNYLPFTNYVQYGKWPQPYIASTNQNPECSQCPDEAPVCNVGLCIPGDEPINHSVKRLPDQLTIVLTIIAYLLN